MPMISADAPVYLAAAIGCLRSLLEIPRLPVPICVEVAKHMRELERLHEQLAEVRAGRGKKVAMPTGGPGHANGK